MKGLKLKTILLACIASCGQPDLAHLRHSQNSDLSTSDTEWDRSSKDQPEIVINIEMTISPDCHGGGCSGENIGSAPDENPADHQRTDKPQGSPLDDPPKELPSSSEITAELQKQAANRRSEDQKEKLVAELEKDLRSLKSQTEALETRLKSVSQETKSEIGNINKAFTTEMTSLLDGLKASHNEKVKHLNTDHSIYNYKSYSFYEEQSRFKTSSHTRFGREIKRSYDFNQSLRKRIKAESWSNGTQRLVLLDKSDNALTEADRSYASQKDEEAKTFLKVANLLTDSALSLTPGVGWAKDIYEAFSGKGLVGGRELDTVDRSMAFFGAMTFGIGSKLKMLFKPAMMIAGISKGSKVGRVVSSAKKLGLSKADEVKDLSKAASEAAGQGGDLSKVLDKYAEAKRLGAGPQLPASKIATFSNGKYFNRKLGTDEVFYRYHGVDNRSGKKFIYTMKKEYPDEQSLRNGVAILDEWGVTMTSKSKVRAPAGSWVSEGIAAPQNGVLTNEIRKGGDYQALFSMPDIPDSWILTTGRAF
jgi:hypothetical protein